METPKQILTKLISSFQYRSCWDKGVHKYTLELLEDIDEHEKPTSKSLLKGATSWMAYSEGGCALIWNIDIAERLCTPSELKQFKPTDDKNKFHYMDWMDIQCRALVQASKTILRVANNLDIYNS